MSVFSSVRVAFFRSLAVIAAILAPLVLAPGAANAQTVTWSAPANTLGWCSANGSSYQCYADPQTACASQHAYYEPNLNFYGYKPGGNFYTKQCLWEHDPGHYLPATVTFQCVSGERRLSGCETELVNKPGTCQAVQTGHPIDILTGAKMFSVNDFRTADGALSLDRNYISKRMGGFDRYAFVNGDLSLANWSLFFDVSIQLAQSWDGSSIATVINPNGVAYRFKRQTDGSYAVYAPADNTVVDNNAALQMVTAWPGSATSVINATAQWIYRDSQNNIWTLQTQLNPGDGKYRIGRPTSVTRPDGAVLTFTWDASNTLTSITDQLGKSLTLTWNMTSLTPTTAIPATIDTITLPGGYKVKYTYETSTAVATTSPGGRLKTVEYLDSLNVVQDSLSYDYTKPQFPLFVTGIRDHTGNLRWKVSYDDNGRATRSEGPNGEMSDAVTYVSAANGASTFSRTVTNALGQQTTFTYTKGSSNWGSTVTGIAGQATTHCPAMSASNTYNTSGHLLTATDEEGRVTKYTPDAKGRPTTIVQGFGTSVARTTGISWSTAFELQTQTVEAGLTTNYTYDTQGRLTVLNQVDTTTQTVPYSTSGQSRTWTYTYGTSGNSLGKLVSIDGPLSGTGDTRGFTYNSNGYLASVTDEVGKTTTVTAWDWRGAPLTVVDPNSVSTTLTYDIHGRVKTMTINPGGSQSQYSYDYDLGGNVSKITLPSGGWLEYTYDTASRLTKIRNDKLETIDLTPNAVGDPTVSVTKTSGGTITAQQSLVYDELGRLIQTLGSASTTATQFAYDKVDNLKTVTDGRGKVSNTSFDALDRVMTQTNPDSQSVNYVYNAQDVVLSHKDGRNLETTFVTNGFGEVIREVSPDRGTRTYWYDNAGRLTKINDADGVETNLAYDNAGRLTGKTFTGAPQEAMTFTYDSVASGNKGNGRLTSVTEQSGGSAFTYDAQGRVTTDAKTIQGLSYSVQYAYNANGQVTQTTLPSGRVITFTRDADGLITGITTKPTAAGTVSTILSSMTYAPYGDLTNATYGNGLTLTRTFNTNDWLTRIAVKDGTTPKFDLSYDYYDDGRLGEIDDNAATGRTVYMSLSNSGRLTYANGPWGQESYAYDAAGNRTGSYLTVGGVTTSNNEITSGTSNRLVQVQDNASVVKRALAYRTGGDLYSDAISGGATYTYQYSARKRLVGVQNNGADAAWYGYDFRDQRVWRRLFNGGSSSEIHYIFDQTGHLLAEHNGYSGALLREYVWADDMPVAVIDKTSGTAVTYFIHNGHLNEPQMMTNVSKAKVWDAYVTPFGSAKVFTTATANVDIRLPGQWYQAEAAGSGLNQNHHRDYDPSLGRYIQVDPIGLNGGQNPYSYVDGMAYDYVDEEGLQATSRPPVGIYQFRPAIGNPNYAARIQAANEYGRRVNPRYRGFQYAGPPNEAAAQRAEQMLEVHVFRYALQNNQCISWNGPGSRLYEEYLRQQAKYGTPRLLPDGRIRFDQDLRLARTPGQMKGARMVREWDPATGQTRQWNETVDHGGNVRSVAPKPPTSPQNHLTFDPSGNYTGRR